MCACGETMSGIALGLNSSSYLSCQRVGIYCFARTSLSVLFFFFLRIKVEEIISVLVEQGSHCFSDIFAVTSFK